VVQPLALPTFPPGNVWEFYVGFLIFLPFLFRFLFLFNQFRRVANKLLPHGGWAIKRLYELPIRGIGLLAFNEVLAFSLPAIAVLLFRLTGDPLGWPTWDETPLAAKALLAALMLIWLLFDMLRIARIRRMLKAIEVKDVDKLVKIADSALGLRGFLRRISGRDKKSTEGVEEEGSLGGKIAKSSASIWALRALKARKLTPVGLLSSVALSATIEVAKAGAGKVSDMVDDKMQEEFEKISKANTANLLALFLRDVGMSLYPLLSIALVVMLFPVV